MMKNILLYTISIFFLITISNASSLAFGEKTGEITYNIIGGGKLTKETNLNIKGTSILRFKNWGTQKKEKDEGVVYTVGAIEYKQKIKRLEKWTKDEIITVDYNNEQLLINKKNIKIIDEVKNLTKIGNKDIAGVSCDMYENKDKSISKCVYKNILLRLEIHIFDIVYIKEATDVKFDINFTSDECGTPDYPIQAFSILKDSNKKSIFKSANLCKFLNNIADKIIDNNQSKNSILNIERDDFINHIALDIYTKEKKYLPKLLVSMKETRECLQLAKNPFEIKQCVDDHYIIKSKLIDDKEMYKLHWDDKSTKLFLDKLEDDIIDLQSKMPCIKRAKNITDLSTCLK